MIIQLSCGKKAVSSFSEASKEACADRDKNGFGARDLPKRWGDVTDTDGTPLGQVSYNGRVWDIANNEIPT